MLAEAQTVRSSFAIWVEIVKDVSEILVIFVGAAWTYVNYFRGRTHRRRLECSVVGLIEWHSGHPFLRMVVTLKNIGLSKVPIHQKGTGLLLYAADVAKLHPAFPIQVQWKEPIAGFEVFAGQKWAEPSEPIAESLLVALPHADGHIYRLALKVVSGRIWWTAETIVEDTLTVTTRGRET